MAVLAALLEQATPALAPHAFPVQTVKFVNFTFVCCGEFEIHI